MFPRISHLIGEPKSNIDQLNSVDYPLIYIDCSVSHILARRRRIFLKESWNSFAKNVSPKRIILCGFLYKATLKSFKKSPSASPNPRHQGLLNSLVNYSI